MSTNFLSTPLIKVKVEVFYHSCPHNVSSGFYSCDPEEIASKLKGMKAVVIVGKYDEEHLKLYKEAALRAGINPLLVRVVDSSWGEKALEENKKILENGWVADLALVEEKGLPLSRRELIRGEIKTVKDRIDKPVWISDMCKLYRACTLCQDSCPYNAIKVDKKSGVSIDYTKCTACGLCVSSCPMSAIQFPSVSQQAIFELSKIKGNKIISCYKDKGNSIKLPCIAMLSAVDLALLRSSGEVELRCPGCELSKNLESLKRIVTDLNEAVGGISLITPEDKIEKKEAKVVTISSFSYLANKAEAMQEIIKQNNLPDITYDAFVNENSCTMCESCAKWCPTSALTIEYTDSGEKLSFNPDKCIGCKICINVCPEGDNGCSSGNKAIKLVPAKKVSHEKKDLMKDEIVRCKVCGAIVGSRKSLNLVKKIMKERGLECDDEWLERCPTHRAEYSFQKFFGMKAKFRPRRGPNEVGGV
ncbi:4Fe-4S dicluster-binding protein [Acidianus ambivalens]|uniref:4Fe-4S dicluster domain-containing protein n=1 Tax=Acidianus ambivalens TaxID=2283 RepID=A0A650CVN0_ACIAM|nr:4Fe-4S binding protein [Acidianus ambivalens]MQL56544.1 4Fe-4S dicluster domain-containing protein [Acidianus ambivalens]QGR21931.1 4Fe-4S dicluster domain-containing protein [Acidianus ambivalens]